MGDVIDIRPDRFLARLREHGDFGKACEQSGLSIDDVTDLCKSNPKFDRSQTECILEFHEEKTRAAMQATMTALKADVEARIKRARDAAVTAWRARHG